MEELELFKQFIHKKYGIKLMQYQIEFSKQILELNEDRILISSRRCGRNFILDSMIEFKLSLK
jgi:hypothetical protein